MDRLLPILTLAALSALAVDAKSSAVSDEYGISDSQNVVIEAPQTDCNAENTSEFADFICEGTVWEGASISEPDKPYNEQFVTGKDWIEGTEVINSKEYMVVWSNRKSPILETTGKAYIRKSGDKIYAIVPERLDIGEFLLYDFSLAPGDVVVTMPYSGGPGFPYVGYFNFYCDETEVINSYGMDFKSLAINVEKNRENLIYSKVRWIKGIGSEHGLLRNYKERSDPDRGYRIFKVYHNGELVYSVPDPYSLSVDRVIGDECLRGDGRIYDLSGREVREGSKGILVRNGKKIIVR